MSKSQAKPRALAQTAFQRAEIDALRRMLTISQGTFSLSIAICNSPALRDHLIAHIRNEMDAIEIVRLTEETVDVFASARRHVSNENPRGVFVVDLEKALGTDKRDKVLQALNVSRESWRAAYPCPVVFWVPEYVTQLLSTRARDLWSWISHSFEFVSEQSTAQAGLQDRYAGDLTLAGSLDVHEKHLRIAELEQRIKDVGETPKGQLRDHALIWLSEIGYLYERLGKLDKAEQAHHKCLHWAKPDRLQDMAIAYGNLGGIYQTRGDLDQAETMVKKSLEIYEKLGRLEGMASDFGNLGLIYRKRRDFEQAETMHKKSLEIYEKLGRLEGMARVYGNLGVICQIRGDLDAAETMQKKSLEIDEKLGYREGMASDYANLGVIYQTRGDLDKAREYWVKAVGLYEKIGIAHMVTRVQGWIDGLEEGQA